jgi:hypothetical protein
MKIKVNSSDPVKKYVVALIKKKTNSSKVTSVIKVEGSPFANNNGFYGQAHRKILNSKSYLGMGTCFVSEQELHDEYPDVFFAPNNCEAQEKSLNNKYNSTAHLFIGLREYSGDMPDEPLRKLAAKWGKELM